MRKAYEDFHERKPDLEGLKAVHGYDTSRAPGRPKIRTQEEIDETPDVEHPLVRTHEDTGRKSFYFMLNRTINRVLAAAIESNVCWTRSIRKLQRRNINIITSGRSAIIYFVGQPVLSFISVNVGLPGWAKRRTSGYCESQRRCNSRRLRRLLPRLMPQSCALTITSRRWFRAMGSHARH